MKRIIIYIIIISISIYLKSCTQDNLQENTTIAKSIELRENQFYIDTSEHVDFNQVIDEYNDSLLEFLPLAVDALIDSIASNGTSNSSTLNLQPINDYLIFQGREPIDLMQYHLDADQVLNDSSSTYMDVYNVLSQYNIYSSESLNTWKDLEAYLDTVATTAAYNNRIDLFIADVDQNPSISAIEKIMLKTYGAIIKVDSSINIRDSCTKCIKRNRRKIFGWRWIIYGGLLLFCVIGTAIGNLAGLLACLGSLGSVLHTICQHCKMCWFCVG